MAEDKIALPSSYGGIITYYNEYKSKIPLKPEMVIVLTIIVIIFVIFLHISKVFG
ncbi:MAG: preprotein translocase subunit Sec61beta [Candidatus Parvarchaeota archaeon]|nr:preprotein translocase subunit Sec61beta [Candidatus Jingweiarchaeum tengchongense]MCW1300077.1 preprotein translocase subunit Sec61beta [Candidatus Jingweiarchaeum tengchongense]MCW1304431.1 preprotein translocase subunit Sec61beta [Candidatus Jingweiarchaeum tengchongense]MCW1305598.1 preprotein translocase subunit Sec61beta [Candidatus Jingweiarchaeum tengchongense]MCW1310979.1 preprotein translocase subunit Sec61beta [Candidatus Jingweiarchaeum tengchongense]